jgi:subtilisin
MFNRSGRTLLLLLVLFLPVISLAQPAGKSYIVVLKDSVPNVQAVAADHSRRHGVSPEHVYQHAIKGYSAVIPAQRLAAIQADQDVAFISEDRPVQAVAQTTPTGIHRIKADAGTFVSNWNGAVAVIDTGSGPHADLNIAGGFNCSTGKSFDDGNGHGTHVAGTIAAKANTEGVIGVAPGARIYSVRVLNNAGSGTFSSIVCGIDWVTANAASKGIKVANMSLGGAGADDGNCGNTNNDALHRAICTSVAAGITYVVAAGNDNVNLAGFVPAAYNEVLTVTAAADFNGLQGGGAAATCRADVDETAADFSNFTTPGSSDVGHTIAAPGVCILSSWKGGGYSTISGTSMASPHVAGTAFRCIDLGLCAGGPSAVIAKLRNDAAAQPAAYGFVGDPWNPVSGRYYGYLVIANY